MGDGNRGGELQYEMDHAARTLGIPPRPTILSQLMYESQQPDVNFGRVAELISNDVAIAATILKTVNSPFFGLRTRVSSIQTALSHMGLGTVAQMVGGLALRNVFSTAGIQMERFWDVSSRIALISSYLSRQLDLPRREEFHTYGLFQDCGIPVLILRFPSYKETLARANEEAIKSFTDVEDLHHPTNHAVIGFLLAKSWGLSDELCKAIRMHHSGFGQVRAVGLPAGSRRLIAVGLLAEKAIQACYGQGLTREWEKDGQDALVELEITEAKYLEHLNAIKERFGAGEQS